MGALLQTSPQTPRPIAGVRRLFRSLGEASVAPPDLFDPTDELLAFPDHESLGGINGTVTLRRVGRGTPSRRRP